jgi:hypothetical protein
MRKQEIIQGDVFSGRKTGRYYSERRVEQVGEHLAKPKQKDTDCLQYIVTNGFRAGRKRNITRASFARWAARYVHERQMDLFDYLK